MKRIATVIVTVFLVLSIPSTALAASSTCQAYNPQDCTSTGSLPFTGLDLALLVGGGCVLLGTGVVVRRLTRRPD